MSEPLYPALKSILGDSYSDLAALPPVSVASIESALMRDTDELDEAYTLLADAEATIDDLRFDIELLEEQ